MWQNLKLAAFLCCLLPWVLVAVRLAVPQSQAKPARGMTTPELRSRLAQQQRPNRVLAVVPIAVSAAGSLLLLVDAFRRSYEGPKALPVAIALTGVISLGLLSIVYYGVWGWLPTREEGARAKDFCGICKNETLERPAPGTSTIGGLFGTQLVGRAQRCDACGSTLKTLWIVFMLPVVPLASYRVLPIGAPTFNRAWYLSRKTLSMHWPHVWPLLMLAAAVAGLIGYLATKA